MPRADVGWPNVGAPVGAARQPAIAAHVGDLASDDHVAVAQSFGFAVELFVRLSLGVHFASDPQPRRIRRKRPLPGVEGLDTLVPLVAAALVLEQSAIVAEAEA